MGFSMQELMANQPSQSTQPPAGNPSAAAPVASPTTTPATPATTAPSGAPDTFSMQELMAGSTDTSTTPLNTDQRSEAFKQQVYSQAGEDFKAGRYLKAAGDLFNLFHNPDELNPKEAAKGVGQGLGQTGLGALSLANKIMPTNPDEVEFINRTKHSVIPQNASQEFGANLESVAEFMLGDAALSKLSYAERLPKVGKAIKTLQESPILMKQVLAQMAKAGITQGTVGTVQGGLKTGTVSGAVQEGVTAGTAGALLAGAGEAVGAGREALSADREAVTSDTENPSLVRQVFKGKDVAQPGAQSAVRRGVQASTEAAGTADESIAANIENQPILRGNQTVLDEPLDALKKNEDAAYKKVDDTVGFDLKAEKDQLANDKYRLSQLGNTDADVTARGNLTEAINDSTDRIAEAEQKLKDAGIDPKSADAVHQQRMAGTDFKKAVVKNTNADGSVNIDGLLKDSKNLRFNRFGDRLEQFMGKEAADDYISRLQEMQKLGAHTVKTQAIAKWVAKGAGTLGTLGYGAHVVHGLLE